MVDAKDESKKFVRHTVFGGDWGLRIIRFSKFQKQLTGNPSAYPTTQKLKKKFFRNFSLTTPRDFNLAIFRPETVFVAYIGNIEAKNGSEKSWSKVAQKWSKIDSEVCFMIKGRV